MSQAIPTPNFLDLLRKRVGADEDETRRFFNIKVKPNERWVSTLLPGLDAAQKLIVPFLAEQTTGDAQSAIEDAERREVCAKIFGNGNLGILKQLARALETSDRMRIDFEKIEDGKFKVAVSNPSEPVAAPAPAPQVPAAPETPKAEPVEGLIPAGPREGASKLETLIESLRPRVRLEENSEGGIEDILAAVLDGKWTRKVAMLLPIYGAVNPHVAFHWMAQIRKQPWLGVHYETETVIQRARNVLADKFLKSESEWALWLDSDIVAPFGDPAFFYDENRLCADPTFIKPEFVAAMTVERLLKAQKTIVGGVYHARKAGSQAPLIIQPCLHPRDAKDRELTDELRAKGPLNKVVQVGYVATGCALMHRSVFRDIQNRFPERMGKDGIYDFFGHDVGTSGEDIAFCGLAQQAGHASYLDCGLWAAHLGTQAFFTPRKLK